MPGILLPRNHSVHPNSEPQLTIALVGNPNCGKSSLFNAFTGLRQQVSNFPGVTVDKKSGYIALEDQRAELVDLPGTYSLYPRRADEWVAYKVLMGADQTVKPDMVVLVADASNLKRNLLFCSQIIDLRYPVVVALTMMDIAASKNIAIDIAQLERELGVPVVPVNPRKSKGLSALKKSISNIARSLRTAPTYSFIDNRSLAPLAVQGVLDTVPDLCEYASLHYLMYPAELGRSLTEKVKLEHIRNLYHFSHTKVQAQEITLRYQRIRHVMQQSVREPDPMEQKRFTERLDDLLLHRVWGYFILAAVLFLLFQSIFWLAQYPMDLIDSGFGASVGFLNDLLPDQWWSHLLTQGLLAGLGGILVFIPQIMILFGLITILEDTGYMARVSFLSDKLMRKVGLNGKSVMPMISGFACAVPAIMSARNIENRKERLLTILVTPLMSCSARLPVFTILISLVIPNRYLLGFLSIQGLVMMGLYLSGVIIALLVSWISKFLVNLPDKSYFILELPVYRAPRWKNALTTMVQKAKIFVVDAGKIIMIISLLIWLLSSFGPGNDMQAVEKSFASRIEAAGGEEKSDLKRQLQSARLSESYIGKVGHFIEPVITPLGYDWKIGIALLTSFAAREVFVGTMATLYSADGEEDRRLRQKMKMARREDNTPVYTLATGMSLMVFYLLAMQCMSTLAIVKRETGTWKWPLIQLGFMTIIAYVLSWVTYLIFS